MSLTLLEAAKDAANNGEDVRSGIIELFGLSSQLLAAFTFDDILGGALAYNREETLPGIGFRGLNEGYVESTGIINPVVETLHIIGGDLDVDLALLKMMGEQRRETEEGTKVKAAALRLSKSLIKGDNTSDPKEVDGLQSRITGDQLISAGSTAGGEPLPLTKLDEVIDAADGATHLVMSEAMRRRLTQASRNTGAGIGGFMTFEQDGFGRKQNFYQDIPILEVGKDELNAEILGFNEAAVSGGSTATSIYTLSIGPDGVSGIQNGGIDVRDLGEIDSKPVMRTRVEWLVGMAIFRGTAAARLQHIADAEVVK